MENLYQELEKDTEKSKKIKAKIQEKLKEYKEQAFLSKKLSQIQKHVPINF
ncbi:unnamed protein product, partial [marine sediment metagenome]